MKNLRAFQHNFFAHILGTFVCLCVVLCISACTEKRASTPSSKNIRVEVDSTLLDISVLDTALNLTFRVPKDWKPLESAMQAEMQAKLAQQDTNDIRIAPKHVFKRVQGKSALAVSELYFPSGMTNTAQKIDEYTKRIKSGMDTSSCQVARFTNNAIPITQIVLRSPQTVAFKLLIPSAGRIFQFDYILALPEFNQNIRAVESSIGSIFISK